MGVLRRQRGRLAASKNTNTGAKNEAHLADRLLEFLLLVDAVLLLLLELDLLLLLDGKLLHDRLGLPDDVLV